MTHLPTAFAGGWLCFESGSERRRLGPIPRGWEDFPDSQLEELLSHAGSVADREMRLDTAKLRAMVRPESFGGR